MASAAQTAPEIPQKSLFRIGEVSRLTDTKTFVLRFWETEFPSLQPVKSPAGHRLYRREDIETVFQIKRLLYEQGFTIAGARRYLAETQGTIQSPIQSTIQSSAQLAASADPAQAHNHPPPAALVNRNLLLELREELLAVLTLLKHE